MILFIIATDEELAIDAARSGFGWESLESARAQLKEISRDLTSRELPNNKLKLYEVTINAKKIS
jgi:hypothetical protein